ncbi:uncharacterized protein LOC133174030 [Saccostrea echinata]|uniref:uncharacterized protein LOC133174030 n=1 Tax=Saccostrea echinata TaxID=191078 RepID=UPI002A83360A|nr:uncharacterized protein LOC133174030 [Saccostrea echinata]
MEKCLQCKKVVKAKQHALCCDGCGGWQHRLCNTGFLQKDISCDGQRHLIFATTEQLDVLANLQTWYVDGTFKVVRSPFAQLFSIHGFLGDQQKQKQVPLAFVLMSRRQTADYVAVFTALMTILPRRAAVQTIVADFERATWAAARETIRGVTVEGCHFHWSQAIWRKVQEVGLQVPYNEDRHIHKTVRCLLSLPFLPEAEVKDAFLYIQDQAQDDDRLLSLLSYVNRNWVESNVFPIPSWNVYRKETRTNNDCEGWHRRLNHNAKESTPPMYLLIPILHSEAEKLPLQKQMVEEGSLHRLQRRDVRERQRLYEDLWEQYEAGMFTGLELLVQLSRVCGPSRL